MQYSAFFLGLIGNIIIAAGIIALVFMTNLIRKRTMRNMENLIAFTVGLMLAIIFLGFLPEILLEGQIAPVTIGMLFLLGIFLFYALELFLHWHHCQDIEDGHDHEHDHENNPLMFTGTFLHNFLHGIILFSAFSVNTHVGVVTTIAVLLHAIPQNIANLLMNHKDIRFAYIAALGGVVGALMIFPFREFLLTYNFHILAVIGGGLLYTAMSDILPSFKEKGELKHKIIYLLCMIIGVGAFIGIQSFGEYGHEALGGEHEDEIQSEADIH